MPSACLFALTTIIAAFQRTKARMRRSMCSSPGNHGSCSRGIVLTYGVRDGGREADLALLGPLEQLGQQEAGAGLAVGVDHGVEGVEPLLGLARIDVGDLVDVAVEDHATSLAPFRRRSPGRCVPFPCRSLRTCQASTSHRRGNRLRPGAGTVPGRAAAGPVVVYTDGACSGNPGPGGWAWAVAPDGVPSAAGGEARTTNQRMEITAALEAVRRFAPDGPVVVVSDSTYVVNCFRDRWYVKWAANGWLQRQEQPVANADLWRPLVELVDRRRRHVPLGQGPQRRPAQRPRRPARRRRHPALRCASSGSPARGRRRCRRRPRGRSRSAAGRA